MPRPSIELADLIRDAGPTFTIRNHPWLTWLHVKVLVADSALPDGAARRTCGCLLAMRVSGHQL